MSPPPPPTHNIHPDDLILHCHQIGGRKKITAVPLQLVQVLPVVQWNVDMQTCHADISADKKIVEARFTEC